jgi:serine/threonine protein kinase
MDAHPSSEQLQAFVRGLLSPKESSLVEMHLMGCQSCEDALEAIPDDPFTSLLRHSYEPGQGSFGRRLTADYEVLEEIGRGGMGVVYKACQPRTHMVVALKRMTHGQEADPEDLLRFRREAQAAARLNHPNIVQIHDSGEQDGHPYIAFELIDGESLAQRLQSGPLPWRDAVSLTATLADAMEHAHQKGVLHRDLKPANVLLDRRPQKERHSAPTEKQTKTNLTLSEFIPKISDFGMAKLVGDEYRHTLTGALIGTPEYMAPEQVDGKVRDLGPATDIYALGVILYQAITGHPPFTSDSIRETLELITKKDPEPLRRSRPNLPVELDTICLKCLEKDPARRYASAAALAADCQAFLEGRPIAARPVSFVGRSWKLVKRRPLVSTLVGAVSVLASSLVIVVVVNYFAITAKNAQLENAIESADHQKELAQSRYQTALRVVDDLLAEAADLDLAGIPDAEEARKRLLRKALAECETLLEDRDNPDPQVQRSLARIYRAAASVHDLLGEWLEAEADARKALAVLDGLPADMAGETRVRRIRAEAYVILAHVYDIEKQLGKAEEAARQVVQIWEQCPEAERSRLELAKAYNTLGLLYQRSSPAGAATAFPNAGDRRAHAKQMYEAIATLLETVKDRNESEDTILASGLINLGTLKYDLRAPPQEIESLFRRGIALLEPLSRKGAPRVGVHDSLAACNRNLGTLGAANGVPPAQCEEYYRKALSYREQLANRFARVNSYKHDVAFEHEALGGLYLDQSNLEESQLKSKDGRRLSRTELRELSAAEFRTAVNIRTPLVRADPAGVNYVVRLTDVYTVLALVLGFSDKADQAEAAYRDALNLMEGLARDHPDGAVYTVSLSKTLMCMGAFWCEQAPIKKTKEGLDYLARAIEMAEGVLKKDPTNVSLHRLLIDYYSKRRMVYQEQKENKPADRDLDRVIGLRENQIRLDPLDRYAKTSLRDRYVERALLRIKQGNLKESYQDMFRAAAIMRPR